MSIGVLDHSIYYSYQQYTDTLTEYYTTIEIDETIMFIDSNSNQLALNSLLLENTGTSTMYIRALPSTYVVTIPSGESRSLDYVKTTGIQVLGDLGQTLRFSGCNY